MDTKNSSAPLWLMFLAVFALVAVILTFTTSDWARKTSVIEAQKIEAAMGASTLEKINELAGDWYVKTAGKWAKELSLESMMSEDSAQRQREKRFITENSSIVKWGEKRKAALLDLAYWFLKRVALVVIWLPMWIPLLLLAAFHGMQDREIKKTDFGYTSPVRNHFARVTIAFTILMTFALFIVPVAVEPWVFPILMGIATVAAGVAFGNVQKRI